MITMWWFIVTKTTIECGIILVIGILFGLNYLGRKSFKIKYNIKITNSNELRVYLVSKTCWPIFCRVFLTNLIFKKKIQQFGSSSKNEEIGIAIYIYIFLTILQLNVIFNL